MKKDFKIIGFDADDTLWINEPYFFETKKQFFELISNFQTPNIISKEFFNIETQNIKLYGYGAKAFMLSLIETAISVSNYKVSSSTIDKIIKLGKDLLEKPVVLLEGVEEVLKNLYNQEIKLIIATKGDLLDQERKLAKSNIKKYFHHIEVMSDKKEADYLRLLSHLDIEPENFMMIGNSLKSDIIPVLNIGGCGVHVPYHTTWEHEIVNKPEKQNNFIEISNIHEIMGVLQQ